MYLKCQETNIKGKYSISKDEGLGADNYMWADFILASIPVLIFLVSMTGLTDT